MTTLADDVDRLFDALGDLFEQVARGLRIDALVAWVARHL